MTAPAEPEIVVRESEREKVYRWRDDELHRAGYEHEHAEALALDTSVDLHTAVELLVRGCEELLAFEIMR